MVDPFKARTREALISGVTGAEVKRNNSHATSGKMAENSDWASRADWKSNYGSGLCANTPAKQRPPAAAPRDPSDCGEFYVARLGVTGLDEEKQHARAAC
jgi:hypothetical protein